jgi:hypothetical protein
LIYPFDARMPPLVERLGDDRSIAVSPRHAVRLAREYLVLIEQPPERDYLVRTILRREANGLPLMSAEIVIAGQDTRKRHPLAVTYPLHFRKTYFAARLGGDPEQEFQNQLFASQLIPLAPPIGSGPGVFRTCLVPGRPYNRLSPFGAEPPESNLRVAQSLDLAKAAGLWRLAEDTLDRLLALHAGGLAHGDVELHNIVVCPAPLEPVVIDFESAVRRDGVAGDAWQARCEADLVPLLREAIYLQCALGRQDGPLAALSFQQIARLFKNPDRFSRAIDEQADLGE